MAESVDAGDLKSLVERRGGSSPSTRIMANSINRPKNHLELGQRVQYTRRACVIRKHGSHGNYYWEPCEVGRFDYITRAFFADNFPDFPPVENTYPLKNEQQKKDCNKSIFYWDEVGAGVVMSLVRKGIGYSYSATGTHSYYSDYDSYEPGGFVPYGWEWFYYVKYGLGIKDIVMVPIDSVRPTNEART